MDEVVEAATDSRALSAFLGCGNHRNPAVRAKSALATLLCVRRRCAAAATASTSISKESGRRDDGWGEGGGGARKGGRGGGVGAREMDRLLATLPRFLQVSRVGAVFPPSRLKGGYILLLPGICYQWLVCRPFFLDALAEDISVK